MGLFRKNKFDKLKKDEVIKSICELEDRFVKIEEGIAFKEKMITELMEKGRNEKSREIQLFHAKRIMQLKDEKQTDAKRGMYIMYNIKLMNRLKGAIEDKEFINITSEVSLGDMLKDQKALAKFLNKTLNTRVSKENVLTQADDLFSEVQASYIENDTIYGANQSDDNLLAMFETAQQDELENTLGTKNSEKRKLDSSELF